MRPSLTISIDFDDTFTADVDGWSQVIALLQRLGHRVICVSARRDDMGNRQEVRQALPDGIPVVLTSGDPKKIVAKAAGHDVDIWIDDMPHTIPTKEDCLRWCG